MVTITLNNKEAEELVHIMQRESSKKVSELLCAGLEPGELNKNAKVKRLCSIYEKIFRAFKNIQ